MTNPCRVCGTEDQDKPMTWRNTEFCCGAHRDEWETKPSTHAEMNREEVERALGVAISGWQWEHVQRAHLTHEERLAARDRVIEERKRPGGPRRRPQ